MTFSGPTCDACQEREPDVLVTYRRLQGRALRWCGQCAVPTLVFNLAAETAFHMTEVSTGRTVEIQEWEIAR